ncbi:DinB family protein [Nocardioides KLBMP 9356]|uniref:DinB family protein n=1 Tax=Nocardioides potassii TaxID=2911371 RepID=A0ABS9HIX3_9ACTN|nr:DinB family protein [Nocardioides potassii]MCF6380043.1 DinB family protein [Nocardioides potassii]
MRRFLDEDLSGAEFRECDLSNARLVGVVMQDAVIDGLVTHLVVNGVDVTAYVEEELDRRHPVRPLIRSDDPDDLRRAARQLRADWAATVARIRRTPGLEHVSVGGEWSAEQTLRHLVFVHDSWFRRCCLGSSELFTPMGLGIEGVPDREAQGLDPSADPTLEEVVEVRDQQVTELEGWLDTATAEQLAAPAPVPDDDRWPTYARGRSVAQCLRTVLTEEHEHHGFCVRDLDLVETGASGLPGTG